MHELEASSGATQVQAAELAGLRDRVTTLTAQLKVCHPCDWQEMTSIEWSRTVLSVQDRCHLRSSHQRNGDVHNTAHKVKSDRASDLALKL